MLCRLLGLVPHPRSLSTTHVAPPTVKIGLHNISHVPGSVKQVKRLGRGGSSGHGGTSGRGHKGQKARSGNGKPRRGFEGGQTPFHQLFPKRGFTNIFKKHYQVLNLDRLQHWIRTGRIDPTQVITMKVLKDSRCVTCIKDGVKLLSQGHEHFDTKVTIEVSKASRGAMASIERAGGKVTNVFHNRLAMRALLLPHKFAVLPKFAKPNHPKELAWYSDVENRGYLAPADAKPTTIVIEPKSLTDTP
ncbi:ribosomal protein L18e/L15P [Dimargaris cristalligena]|uniref:Ribosomal protein L18e/L15P n=1 Tax=Dimargaris cristalligena TaxID=215637 RepID=A0A4P9ZZG2_9FUNG|nr:ribosomal protein L18e/L15P [Dimargaris cristalligena]|eukprot:RKP39166.1 ribosomal protein L18e/L15P [Dimargaris cristalligena]